MNEAELCALFAEAARQDGWTVYPEVNDWDLVLVWNNPDGRPKAALQRYGRSDLGFAVRQGDIIAIEAKSRATTAALMQAHKRQMPPATTARTRKGPDFKAVLVPKAPKGFKYVAGEMELGVFTSHNYEEQKPGGRRWKWTDPWRVPIEPAFQLRLTERWAGKMWLPPVVPENDAGVPSPTSLTPWRVKALKICALLRTRGGVTSADFNEIGISITRWRNNGRYSWLVDSGERDGNRYIYVLPDELPDDFPDIGWEAERDLIWEQHLAQEEE